jgi:hypothetical protein
MVVARGVPSLALPRRRSSVASLERNANFRLSVAHTKHQSDGLARTG